MAGHAIAAMIGDLERAELPPSVINFGLGSARGKVLVGLLGGLFATDSRVAPPAVEGVRVVLWHCLFGSGWTTRLTTNADGFTRLRLRCGSGGSP